MALHKVERGHIVKCIGAVYSVRVDGVQVSVDKDRIDSKAGRTIVTGMRSLAGELSWVAGIAPTTRPFVNMILAALTRTSKAKARGAGKGLKGVSLLQWCASPGSRDFSMEKMVVSNAPASHETG